MSHRSGIRTATAVAASFVADDWNRACRLRHELEMQYDVYDDGAPCQMEPDFCCQELAGLCTDGVMVNDVPREVRCYTSSAQGLNV